MSYSAIYDPDTDFDRVYTDATAEAIARSIAPGERVLELGCATGRMTAALAAAGARVTAVERSADYLARLAERGLRDVGAVCADLDRDPLPDGSFDHVVVANVLHELADPVGVLAQAGARLSHGGLVHLTLQNPRSLHRLVALEMGMIDDVAEVSARGERYGTRVLWDVDALASLAARAGLTERRRSGLVLKPLPNAWMEQLPEEIVEGFVAAARHLPGHAAVNYLVLGRG